jgi:predicted membrane channel-forming protein YqfA (hemolysin III family)
MAANLFYGFVSFVIAIGLFAIAIYQKKKGAFRESDTIFVFMLGTQWLYLVGLLIFLRDPELDVEQLISKVIIPLFLIIPGIFSLFLRGRN